VDLSLVPACLCDCGLAERLARGGQGARSLQNSCLHSCIGRDRFFRHRTPHVRSHTRKAGCSGRWVHNFFFPKKHQRKLCGGTAPPKKYKQRALLPSGGVTVLLEHKHWFFGSWLSGEGRSPHGQLLRVSKKDALSVSSIAGSSVGPVWCKQPGACTSSCPSFLCPAPLAPSLPQA